MRGRSMIATGTAAALLAVATYAAPTLATCQNEHGMTCDICGTDGDDTLIGTNANEVICGLGGNDYIDGGGNVPEFESLWIESDRLFGGPGDDTLIDGTGSAFLYGGPGDDVLDTRPGVGASSLPSEPDGWYTAVCISHFSLEGGIGDDLIFIDRPGRGSCPSMGPLGGPGNDTIHGSVGGDVVSGGIGNDRLIGYGGNDTLYGGPGNDAIFGGPGNDRTYGGPGADLLSGGPGADRLGGFGGRDNLFGNAGDDRLNGGPGRGDRLRGGAGNDDIDSIDGAKDYVYGGAGVDRAQVDRGLDVVKGVEERQ